VKKTKHFGARTKGATKKLYTVWNDMHRRCYSPRAQRFEHYGGRGIHVCKRWNKENPKGYENFFDDMGNPEEGMSIDRINVNGNYEPKNCRWSTRSVQNKGRRKFGSISSFTPEEIADHLKSKDDTYLLDVFKQLKRKR
jgi:hypothetical protein